jgi:hypothetical protein
MKITEDLITQIMAACPKERDLSLWVARRIAMLQDIDSRLTKICRERDEFKKTCSRKLDEFDRLRHEIQLNCPHYLTTRHADPSGGSDSWNECNLCGKDLS